MQANFSYEPVSDCSAARAFRVFDKSFWSTGAAV